MSYRSANLQTLYFKYEGHLESKERFAIKNIYW